MPSHIHKTGAPMADVLHGSLQPGASSGIHPIHHWVVTSEAARTNLTVVATDVGKVCRQLVGSDVSWWVLSAQSGGVGTWTRLDNTTAAGPAVRWFDVTATEIGGVDIEDFFSVTGTPTLTAADVGSMAMNADWDVFVFVGYQVDTEAGVT